MWYGAMTWLVDDACVLWPDWLKLTSIGALAALSEFEMKVLACQCIVQLLDSCPGGLHGLLLYAHRSFESLKSSVHPGYNGENIAVLA